MFDDWVVYLITCTDSVTDVSPQTRMNKHVYNLAIGSRSRDFYELSTLIASVELQITNKIMYHALA